MDKEISEQVEQIKREWDNPVASEPGLIFVGENITVEQAINRLRQELQKDNGPYSYFYTWQSNIAMAFYDTFMEVQDGATEEECGALAMISNIAAAKFLNTLCSQPNNINLTKQNELPKL